MYAESGHKMPSCARTFLNETILKGRRFERGRPPLDFVYQDVFPKKCLEHPYFDAFKISNPDGRIKSF